MARLLQRERHARNKHYRRVARPLCARSLQRGDPATGCFAEDGLEQAADLLGTSPHGSVCKGMEGLIAEGQELLRMDASSVKDLALTGAARKVEHYEIASYCGTKELAEACGNLEVLALLQTTEEEEKSTEKLLMALGAKAAGSSPSNSEPMA